MLIQLEILHFLYFLLVIWIKRSENSPILLSTNRLELWSFSLSNTEKWQQSMLAPQLLLLHVPPSCKRDPYPAPLRFLVRSFSSLISSILRYIFNKDCSDDKYLYRQLWDYAFESIRKKYYWNICKLKIVMHLKLPYIHVYRNFIL